MATSNKAKKKVGSAKPAKAAPKAKAAKPARSSKPVKPAKPAAKAKPEAVKVASKPATPAPSILSGAPGGDKMKPKGITIVANKPSKKAKPKRVIEMPSLGPSLASTLKKWKPLIPSGPNAPRADVPGGNHGEIKPRSDFGKKDYEQYKQVLMRKRAELVGDVSAMENQALQGGSGSLSHTPQHLAEQGSETSEQSLSLDLAQVDRNLIKEIDDALDRIAKGTYGICEMTHKPISRERLDELPWTRYSIEAARMRERLYMR